MMWTFRYLALAIGVIFQLSSVVGYASWMQVSDLCVCVVLSVGVARAAKIMHCIIVHFPYA